MHAQASSKLSGYSDRERDFQRPPADCLVIRFVSEPHLFTLTVVYRLLSSIFLCLTSTNCYGCSM